VALAKLAFIGSGGLLASGAVVAPRKPIGMRVTGCASKTGDRTAVFDLQRAAAFKASPRSSAPTPSV
jgi:hypothetical protein